MGQSYIVSDEKITGKDWFVCGALEGLFFFRKEFYCPCNPAGKTEKTGDAKVLLRSTFFTDILAEAKKFKLLKMSTL